MRTKKNIPHIKQIRINPRELDDQQPLARFMISLFNLFEDELIAKIMNTTYKDLTRTDLNTLRYIGHGGETSSQLANYAGISKQAMSKQIESLSRRGYVDTVQDKNDARVFRISFSKKGNDLVTRLIEIIKEIELRHETKIGKSAYRKMKTDLQLLISLYLN
ncbi:MAG: MarR family transcriptional regulator [Bdellovibrionales bacterium]|nr:MarR family transcriptional regulator [Bdellovibrionales bacterium]